MKLLFFCNHSLKLQQILFILTVKNNLFIHFIYFSLCIANLCQTRPGYWKLMMFWSWQISKWIVMSGLHKPKELHIDPKQRKIKKKRSFIDTVVPISAQKPISRCSHWSGVELHKSCKIMDTSLQVLSIHSLIFLCFS